MEKELDSSEQVSGNENRDFENRDLEHDFTVMLNEPIKVSTKYGEKLSDLLDKAVEELKKIGKEIDLKEYDIMLNNRIVSERGKLTENPVLIRASVISLVKKITGGNMQILG